MSSNLLGNPELYENDLVDGKERLRVAAKGILDTSNIKSTNVRITNLTISTINTEVSHSLIANLKTLLVRHRGIANVKYSFVNGESGTKYITLPRGSTKIIENILFSSKVLYLQADKTGILEIEEYY